MLLLLVLACAGNIGEMYEAEKAAALAAPPAPGGRWNPELRLRISEETLGRAAREMVAAGALQIDKTYGVDNPLNIPLKARPSARVTRLDVSMGEDCGGCLLLDARLEGRTRWTAGPAEGAVPFDIRVAGQMRFSTQAQGQGWQLTGRIVEIGRVKVRAGSARAVDLAPVVRRWATEALKEAPPLQLGHLGGAAMPLRAIRIGETAGALEIEALGDVAGGRPVPPASAPPSSDWDLRIHPDTALALMRRMAFEAGPQELDVAIDPRALAVDGDRFTLALRLWRLKGAGWWRDYTVEGRMGVQRGALRMVGRDAREGEKSRGAGLADPVALLAEGRILDAVGDGVDQSLPAAQTIDVKGVRLAARLDTAQGDASALAVAGTLQISAAGTRPREGRRGGRPD